MYLLTMGLLIALTIFHYISALWIVMGLVGAGTSSCDLTYQSFRESSERSEKP